MGLQEDLIAWYQSNKRDLPWRNTNDPYKIWISEVILQQTRVVQGLPYYYKFLELFPTVDVLANAEEQEVLRCWQGLGYYSRARNMHVTAKIVSYQLKNIFPSSYKELIALKGIGPYTAAAVSSFSANENVAVLDGNVMRVLARLFSIKKNIAEEKTKKELQLLANEILLKGNAAVHNQAIMELGALICVPKNPKCELCPVSEYCLAFANNLVDELPFKSKKVKVTARYFNYLVFKDNNGDYYFNKRDNSDIWSGLWDFYLTETEQHIDNNTDLNVSDLQSLDVVFLESTTIFKHQLTHQTIWAKFWIFELINSHSNFVIENELKAFSIEEIHNIPKPILINNFLKKYLFL